MKSEVSQLKGEGSNIKGDTSISRAALKKNPWTRREIKGLTIFQSPLLLEQPLKAHAFTTRLGGETPHPFSSFNLGRHDAAKEFWDDALKNRYRLCDALSISADRMRVPGQVHSAKVEFVEETEVLKEVDGLYTKQPDTPILLHFADCVPIIIFERNRSILSVVHAGWRGTASFIAKNAVEEMTNKLGARAEDMVAAVGPAIGTCCYPTSAEVGEQLSRTVSNARELIEHDGEQPRPDLRAINAMQLLESGVSEVDVCDLCTCCHPELFYSHRQSGGITGRQGALACL